MWTPLFFELMAQVLLVYDRPYFVMQNIHQ